MCGDVEIVTAPLYDEAYNLHWCMARTHTNSYCRATYTVTRLAAAATRACPPEHPASSLIAGENACKNACENAQVSQAKQGERRPPGRMRLTGSHGSVPPSPGNRRNQVERRASLDADHMDVWISPHACVDQPAQRRCCKAHRHNPQTHQKYIADINLQGNVTQGY
eukprot:216263-Chlamydomonas_euryale.AAC.5